MRVGLLGGTFDPAHKGHAHIANVARKRLGLSKVWWLVTPQNPLKPRATSLRKRMEGTRKIARGPANVVTDFEQRLGLSYSIDTIRAFGRLYPGVRFVLLVGADNLLSFRRWRRWDDIMRSIPVAIVARPNVRLGALFAKPFARFGGARIDDPRRLADAAPPAWAFLTARHCPVSSTRLRSRAARR
jgi:nicotinate-nucleotide adenylyltransferase